MLREPHLNGGAGPQFADDIQGAAVQFDLGLDQRQTQPGAFILRIQGSVDLAEFFQGLGEICWIFQRGRS
jgi:hypothetical protein